MQTPIARVPKGEMLSRIFARIDQLDLSNKMRQLFINAGMDVADLTELRHRNKAAFNQWYKYYHHNKRLTSFTTYTVLEY